MKQLSWSTLGVAAWLAIGGQSVAHAQIRDAGDFEFFGGATSGLAGARAFVSTGRQTVDSGERMVLPTVGVALNAWWGKSRIFGSLFDVSFVDAGQASASIGSNASDVKGYAVDGHIGVQVQVPGRVRPYAYLAGGFVRTSLTSQLTLFGRTSSVDLSDTSSSLIYGGGVRLMGGDSWGVRFGVDGVNISKSKQEGGSLANYARVLCGSFVSF
jgi:hypothetical protein